MTATSRLTVARASCAYVVPRDHPAPDDVRRRADVVFRERVPAACTRALSLLVRDDDPSIVLIDRLDVDLALGGALDEQRLAEAWSSEIARELARRISRGEGVLHFATRAAFIARFVADAAAGRDGGRWYYAQFESLSPLPTATKLAEAIVREPEEAFAIVAELVRLRRFDEVVATLSERGALAVWHSAFARGECNPSPQLIELLLAEWSGGDAATPRAALRLASIALTHAPHESAASIRAHVDALLALAEALRADDGWTLVEALIERDLARALRIVDQTLESLSIVEPLQLLIELAATRADLITCAASTVRAAAPALADDALVASAFAGYAMLLPFVPEELDAASRVLLLARCADRDELQFDPLAQLLRGDEEFEEPAIAAEELAREADRVMRAFANCLPGFSRSSDAHLRENLLDGVGAIRTSRERIDIHLPRVPLAVLLRITGADGKTFTLPWLGDRPIVLHLPEDA